MRWFKSNNLARQEEIENEDLSLVENPAKPITLSDHLSANRIISLSPQLSKEDIFQKLIATMDLSFPELALEEINAREALGSTIIAPGIALPHARVSWGPRSVTAALGISREGINLTSNRIHLFLLFMAPKDRIRDSLVFLASASSLLQTENLKESLLTLESSESVMAKIQNAERQRKGL